MSDFKAISGDQREFEFIGVGGPKMIDAGLKSMASIDQFLVNLNKSIKSDEFLRKWHGFFDNYAVL